VSAEKVEDVSRWQLLAKEAHFRPAKLAALCGVSERHLQRIFKERLGCPPSKWLRALRCGMARELITQGHSNKAVAAELGFLRDAHFCREFKRHFGVSPRKFAAEGSC
jgi:AraC-like DNA-binding protein